MTDGWKLNSEFTIHNSGFSIRRKRLARQHGNQAEDEANEPRHGDGGAQRGPRRQEEDGYEFLQRIVNRLLVHRGLPQREGMAR